MTKIVHTGDVEFGPSTARPDCLAPAILEIREEESPVDCHILELQAAIERSAAEAIQRHYPLDWKEDPITHDLLIRLRDVLRRVTVRGMRHTTQLELELYKLHGPSEFGYGDIGLLVRYAIPDDQVLEGAGFLEAKLRGRGTTKFTQVRHEQVSRILARSPQTRLLLYDYNPVTVLPDNAYPYDKQFVETSQAVVLPMQLAAAVNHYDDTLYRFAFSLSNQLCGRYMALHDLDFSDTAVNAVKHFPSTLGAPNTIMILRMAPMGLPLPPAWAPNDNAYGPFE